MRFVTPGQPALTQDFPPLTHQIVGVATLTDILVIVGQEESQLGLNGLVESISRKLLRTLLETVINSARPLDARFECVPGCPPLSGVKFRSSEPLANGRHTW